MHIHVWKIFHVVGTANVNSLRWNHAGVSTIRRETSTTEIEVARRVVGNESRASGVQIR